MNSRASHRTLDGSTEIEAQDEHKLTLHKHIRDLDLPTSSLGACFAAFTYSSAFQHCYRAF